MEYKESIKLLKENIEIRELVIRELYQNALDKLNKQHIRLYKNIDLKEYTLSEIELLDGT